MRFASTTVQLLLRLITDPGSALALDEGRWDSVIRTARAARLLGTLGAALARQDVLARIPEGPRLHLESGQVQAAYRRQMVWRELRDLERLLMPLGMPIVLLKGTSYIVQGLICADGRLLSDIDLMVPRDRMAAAEDALVQAGWETKPLDSYDDNYYRAWSHQIPPLRRQGYEIEIDLHHAIIAPTARRRPDPELLFRAAVSLPQSVFRVLAPADQVLHACAHLFQEEIWNRLRDLVDLRSLLTEFGSRPGFWNELPERAASLNLGRPLWYAIASLDAFMGWRPPPSLSDRVAGFAPPGPIPVAMLNLIARALPPPDVDGETSLGCWASRQALLARSLWLKFPLSLLARHITAKTGRVFSR